jgi:SAM-dependent methyltransferase
MKATGQSKRFAELVGCPASFAKRLLWQASPKAFKSIKWLRDMPGRRSVEKILSSRQGARTYDNKAVFEDLQKRFGPFPKYCYDEDSLLKRGEERSCGLLTRIGVLRAGQRRVLEVGCGDGMLGVCLKNLSNDVTLIDLKDWRDPRAKTLKFIQCDVADGVPLPDRAVDLCVSFNTFEHVLEPEAAFSELVRVTAPGGYIYLDFGPLYCSPWGMHLYRSLRMPYPQFLFSREYLQVLKKAIGVNDIGQVDEPFQPLNMWAPRQFKSLWSRDDCRVVEINCAEDRRYLNIIREFPAAFQGRGLVYDDVVTCGIQVLVMKV